MLWPSRDSVHVVWTNTTVIAIAQKLATNVVEIIMLCCIIVEIILDDSLKPCSAYTSIQGSVRNHIPVRVQDPILFRRRVFAPSAIHIGIFPLQSVAMLSLSVVVRLHCVRPTFPDQAGLDICTVQSLICATMLDQLRLPTSDLDLFRLCRITVTSV